MTRPGIKPQSPQTIGDIFRPMVLGVFGKVQIPFEILDLVTEQMELNIFSSGKI